MNSIEHSVEWTYVPKNESGYALTILDAQLINVRHAAQLMHAVHGAYFAACGATSLCERERYQNEIDPYSDELCMHPRCSAHWRQPAKSEALNVELNERAKQAVERLP